MVSLAQKCYYHPDISAFTICNRCKRPICEPDTVVSVNDLVLCPMCNSSQIKVSDSKALVVTFLIFAIPISILYLFGLLSKLEPRVFSKVWFWWAFNF